MDWPHVRSAILSRWPLHSLRDDLLSSLKTRIIIFYYNFNRSFHSLSLPRKGGCNNGVCTGPNNCTCYDHWVYVCICPITFHCYHHWVYVCICPIPSHCYHFWVYVYLYLPNFIYICPISCYCFLHWVYVCICPINFISLLLLLGICLYLPSSISLLPSLSICLYGGRTWPPDGRVIPFMSSQFHLYLPNFMLLLLSLGIYFHLPNSISLLLLLGICLYLPNSISLLPSLGICLYGGRTGPPDGRVIPFMSCSVAA